MTVASVHVHSWLGGFARRVRRSRRSMIVLFVLLIGVVLGGLLRFTRGTPTRELKVGDLSGRVPPASVVSVRTVELLSGFGVVPGNRVQLFMNGDLYAALWRDLRAARSTITVQTYYAQPGSLADSLRTILVDRARAGVRVLLLLDAFGSQAIPPGYRGELEAAGVRVAVLRKLDWSTLHNAANRSHVRAVVIDGRVGYTGGFGFADYWLGHGVRDNEWRESNVRFDGPASVQLQAAFAAAWAEATGELLAGDAFFPADSAAGGVDAAVFFSRPNVGNTSAERFLMLMISGATRRLYITNSYFVPNEDFRRALKIAAARGVDVRVLTAGPKTDVRTTRLAGRFYYPELLDAGIRIYEYAPTMMHAKAMVVDGNWSTIGSMNFDNRSLAFNDELSLFVVNPDIGAQMDSIFRADLSRSIEMTPATFGHRSWTSRLLERGAALLSRVL